MTEEIGKKLVGDDWYNRLSVIMNSPEFDTLGNFLDAERKKYTIYPAKENIFKAFKETPFNSVKVVILSQDPYHNGSATGLAFANDNKQIVPQPSLRKILDEVERDVYKTFDFDRETKFDLLNWAHQGVFLLNTALTVREKDPNSHSEQWKFFTSEVIKALNEGHSGLIWMLWGNNAKTFKQHIDINQHYVLEAGHPASGCYGKDLFSGCSHFSKANEYLKLMNGTNAQINW